MAGKVSDTLYRISEVMENEASRVYTHTKVMALRLYYVSNE